MGETLMKTKHVILFSFCLLSSFIINNTLFANDDLNTSIKAIGYAENGNQWLLTITEQYISTNDPKIFKKEIVTSLKPLVCKNCNYIYNNIVCQKNRNLMDGDEVNCKDADANVSDAIQSTGKINCYGKQCRLRVSNFYLNNVTGSSVSNSIGRNILYEMGNAEFNLDDRIIVNKVDQKNKNDVTNSKTNISEKS